MWVRWGDADSFGHADNNRNDVVGVFSDQKLAKEAYQKIQSATGLVEIEYEDGTKNRYYPGWLGYFEHGIVYEFEETKIQ